MKIGAHAVLFKQKIADETDAVLSELSEAGFAGVEIGARFFSLEDKGKLVKSLEKNHIELSGLHVGTDFEKWIEDAENTTEMVLKVAEFLEDMPNKNIIMSAMSPEGVDMRKVAGRMNEVALRCAEIGVRLNYHNHAHEFANNMKIFRTFFEYAPVMYFGVDLGWVYKAGYDPIEIVKRYGDRISYVHLRDANHRESQGFAELGEGIFDYPALISTLQATLGDCGWAVVEYEEGPEDIERYKQARRFVKNVGY